jgi:hypothetical protein
VYLGCTIAAARTLRGPARACAAAAAAGVVLLLAFCGWTLAAAAVIAIPVMLASHWRSRGSG